MRAASLPNELAPIRSLLDGDRSPAGAEPVVPIAAPRLVLVHVMKTAGTSIIEWIQRHYAFDEVLRKASIWRELKAVPPEVLKTKKFIRGHFGSQIDTVFRREDGYCYITLLRDPVERVISHYWHSRRAPAASNVLEKAARKSDFSFEEFLEHPAARPFVRNYQVRNFAFDPRRHFAGRAPRLAVPDDLVAHDLERAKATLERYDVIGTTEELGLFVDDMCRRFGFYPERALPRRRSYRDSGLSISDAALRRVRQLNELDYDLYEWARRLALVKRVAYWLPKQRILPMSTPLDASARPFFQWSVKDPFFGSGWSETQCADAREDPAHRWMNNTTDAEIAIRVRKGGSYLLMLDILRFVDEDQARTFSLTADGEPVALLGPTRTASSGAGGGLYLAQLGARASELCVLRFHVNSLKSFSEVNPADADSTPRGLAIRSLTLLQLDDNGRVDLGALGAASGKPATAAGGAKTRRRPSGS